ncbi:MAG: XdhC family protein, partial [Paracoccaceae bacterium]
LAPQFDFAVTACAPEAELAAFADVPTLAGYDLTPLTQTPYIVVATQGKGDEAALRAALTIDTHYLAFVGSRKKMAALRARLTDVVQDRLTAVRAPAGLDLGAITPAEIALSIMSEILLTRRRGQRAAEVTTAP